MKEILKFTAPWCGACKTLTRYLKNEVKLDENIKITEIDIDQEPELGTKYGIRALPTMIKLVDGKEVGRQLGVTSPTRLQEWING